jgi:hypothetical protein
MLFGGAPQSRRPPSDIAVCRVDDANDARRAAGTNPIDTQCSFQSLGETARAAQTANPELQ